MDFRQFLSNLQHKSYATRIKILWITTATIGLILVIIWGYSVKSQIENLEGGLIDLPEIKGQQELSQFIKVERIEKTSETLQIFFSVENDTDDILNFSKKDEIKFKASGETISLKRLTDRQNKPFVSKVLSHTENFGILKFPATQDSEAELIFDGLYFESKPETLFKESLQLDLDALDHDQKLRN